MKSGQTNLAGIRYRIDVHEGMATFVECDRMSCARITIQKTEPHGLLYARCESSTGFVPTCHVLKALKIAETLFGPNHYPSIAAKHRNERNIALSHILRRPIFRLTQRLFWSDDLPFRFASVWRVFRHHFRLLFPERKPWIDWAAA